MKYLTKIKQHLVINRDAYVLGTIAGAFVWGCVVVHHDLKGGSITIRVIKENTQ